MSLAQAQLKKIENSLCSDDEGKKSQIREILDDPRINPMPIHHEKMQATGENPKILNQDIEKYLLSEKQNDSHVPKNLHSEEFVETLRGLLCITQQESKIHACKKTPIREILIKVTCIIMFTICYAVVTKIMNR